MPITPYHAKLFAHELTKRSASDSVEKLATALSDAQVTLNPHQIEAALFAFRSPLSKGAILADEVGLGKTIEAGILLAQRWAERHRRLLVICPANLRKQWSQELADKFFLPTAIVETKTFNESVRSGNLNPFDQSKIIICSFQFARAKEPYLRQTAWDLVVIDEAHRLRNVYKPANKIGKAIKGSLANRHKVLLTATPLQNSLEELYGLVSIIDEFTFGDLRSFKAQFGKLRSAQPISQAEVEELLNNFTLGKRAFSEKLKAQEAWFSKEYGGLKERLKPICQRTLRQQVLQYVSYTKRHALVQEFVPTEEEQRLYNLVSDYLQQPNLYALPSSQRQLMTLMLRKLLASSTQAISGTLAGLAAKLEAAERESAAVEMPPEFEENFELLPEIEEEWAEDDEDSENESPEAKKPVVFTPEQREERRKEIARLKEFYALASSIQKNSKGEQLLTALQRGFAKAGEVQTGHSGAIQQKALIFTESRRTQDYLFGLLQDTEFAGKVVLFNGSNTDELSQRIYRDWAARYKGTDRITGSPTADKRAALVDFFRDEASIMIATEAAAEGINLQFCNLVVNYDLPWNPQRIEQRIGRCHRYGQKFDVVVVNFLNKANAADVRVYQLLAEKFRLFDGVFGASDEVLGAIESGIDFEKRIVSIYQQCRTPEQITLQFNELQHELEAEIDEAKVNAQEQLLNNFDQEVIERVRLESATALDRFQDMLWRTTQFYLAPHADFSDSFTFTLRRNPFPDEDILLGPYQLRKQPVDANTYRIGHPLAQRILGKCYALDTPVAELRFQLTGPAGSPVKRIAALEPLVGKSGWLQCSRVTISSLDEEQLFLFAGLLDDGTPIDATQCRRLFDLDGDSGAPLLLSPPTQLAGLTEEARLACARTIEDKNRVVFEAEIEKLDRWGEDQRVSLKVALEDADEAIAVAKKESRLARTLPEKLEHERRVRQLQTQRTEAWRAYDEAAHAVDGRKDALLDDIAARLRQTEKIDELLVLRWRLV
jgi:ERCC4-related helicase